MAGWEGGGQGVVSSGEPLACTSSADGGCVCAWKSPQPHWAPCLARGRILGPSQGGLNLRKSRGRPRTPEPGPWPPGWAGLGCAELVFASSPAYLPSQGSTNTLRPLISLTVITGPPSPPPQAITVLVNTYLLSARPCAG